MIFGTGTDIVKTERIKKAKESFFKRTYTQRELEALGGSALRLAGSFAAKEAVAKALGTGFRGFMPIDIEVLRSSEGKPYVILYNGAARFKHLNIHISISHEKDYAVAFAVAERREEQ